MPSSHYILLSGAKQSGKSALVKKLCERTRDLHPFSTAYEPTDGIEYHCFNTQGLGKFAVWDVSGDLDRSSAAALAPLLSDTPHCVILHCVDLSHAFNVDALLHSIREMQAIYPGTTIRFIGTKADSVNAPIVFEKLQSVSQQLELPFSPIRTSAKTDLNILLLRTFCQTLSDRISLYQREKENFLKSIEGLPWRIIRELRAELDKFERAKDKSIHLRQFQSNCTEILKDHHPFMRSLLTFVAVIGLALLIASMGFGIGLAVGSWAVPVAFVSGLAVAAVESTAVIVSACVFGMFGGGYSAYRAMKTPEVERLLVVRNALCDFS